MSVSGLCQVCETAEAVGSCDSCGMLVCRDHHEREMGLCTQCAGDRRDGGGGRSL